jgi:anti-sigma factor RsiW
MNVDDILLMSYVDDEVSPQQRAEVEAALAQSPELAQRAAALRASRLPYQAAFRQQALSTVPPALAERIAAMAQAAARAPEAISPAAARPRPASPSDAAAASTGSPAAPAQPAAATPATHEHRLAANGAAAWLALAFVAGAFICGAVLRYAPGAAQLAGVAPRTIVATAAPLPWIQSVVGYQSLYTRDTLADLDNDPATTARMVHQIHQDDALPINVPDLSAAGLTFKRVQRLRFNGRALVQIAYLPQRGAPVALCVIGDSKPDQALQVQQVGGMKVVTWRRQHLSYALLAKDGEVDLPALGAHLAHDDAPTLFGALHAPAPAAPLG